MKKVPVSLGQICHNGCEEANAPSTPTTNSQAVIEAVRRYWSTAARDEHNSPEAVDLFVGALTESLSERLGAGDGRIWVNLSKECCGSFCGLIAESIQAAGQNEFYLPDNFVNKYWEMLVTPDWVLVTVLDCRGNLRIKEVVWKADENVPDCVIAATEFWRDKLLMWHYGLSGEEQETHPKREIASFCDKLTNLLISRLKQRTVPTCISASELADLAKGTKLPIRRLMKTDMMIGPDVVAKCTNPSLTVIWRKSR